LLPRECERGAKDKNLEILENFGVFVVFPEITIDSEKPMKTAYSLGLSSPVRSVCDAISLLTWSCLGDSIR
jgi:hypothetical protein